MAYIGPKVSSILETEINWNNIKNVPASISKVFQSDGSTTEFDLGYTPLNVESVRVSVNQMLKVPYTDYNIINDTILKINYIIPNGLTINAVFTPILAGHSSGIFSVQDDQSPKLGGDLDTTGKKITSSGSTNIKIESGIGNYVEIEGFKFPKTDGTAHQVLKTDGSGSLYWGVGPNTFGFPDIQGNIAASQIPDNSINVDKLSLSEGTAGQALKTDGAGVLYWDDVNLGVIDSATQIVDNSIGPEKLTFGNTNFTILTGDGSTATFNLEHAAPSDESVIVIYQGYILQPYTDYTINEVQSTITFVNPPGSNESVQLRYLGIVTQTQGIPYYSVGVNQLNAAGQAIGKTLQISANNEIEWATPSTSTVTATVQQVNAGSGLTGGPITTTGTISLDGSTVTTLQQAATAYAWGSHGTQGYINDPTTINLQQLGNVGTPTASDDTKALVWDETTQAYIYQQIDLSNIFVEQSGKTFTSQDIAIGANLFDTTLTVNIDANNKGISIVKADSVGKFFIDGSTLDIVATGMALDSITNATGNISFQINKDTTTPIEVLKLDGTTGKAVFAGPIQLTTGVPASTTDTIYVDQNALWFGAKNLFDASTVGGISPANIVTKDGTNNMSGGQLNFSGSAILNVQSNNLQFNGTNQGIRHELTANYGGGANTFNNMIYSAKSTVAGNNNTNVPTGAHIFRVGSEDTQLAEDDVLVLEHRSIEPGIGGLISLGAADKMWDGLFTEEVAFHNFGSADQPDDLTYRLYVKQGVLYFGSQIINTSNILSPVTALADVNIPDPNAITEGQTLTWNDTLGKWENRTNTFTGLSDTPGSMTALKFLQINAGGTGFQEVDIPSGVSGLTTFLEMTDSPIQYATHGQKFVKVNQAENALEFVSVNIPDALDDVGVDITTNSGNETMLVKDGGSFKMSPITQHIPNSLTDFNDFPNTYVNMENKLMQISGDATSVVFIDKTTLLSINDITDVNIPDLAGVTDNFLRIAAGEVTAVDLNHKMIKDFPQPGSAGINDVLKYDTGAATFQYHNFYRNQGDVATLANSVTTLEPGLFSYSIMDTSTLTTFQLILPTTNSKVIGDWFRILIAFDGTNNGTVNLNSTQQSGSEKLEGVTTFAVAYGNAAKSFEIKMVYAGANAGWCPTIQNA